MNSRLDLLNLILKQHRWIRGSNGEISVKFRILDFISYFTSFLNEIKRIPEFKAE